MRSARAVALLSCLAAAGSALPSSAYSPPGTTTLVVRSDLTGKVPRTGGAGFDRISADGRYVVYDSTSSDIVLGDTNLVSDVFEWDRITGKTTRVSVASNGMQGVPAKVDTSHPLPQGSVIGDVSADGRYVVFTSDDVNLVSGDTNLQADVFVHDRVSGWTKRVSVSSTGTQGDGPALPAATISADGRYVAFLSSATDLVPGDTNNRPDVFVHDMVTGRTTRASDDSTGACCQIAISADDRHVAYSTYDPGNQPAQVWERDLRTGTKRRGDVPVTGPGTGQQTPLLGGAFVVQDGLSRDGRYVVFSSSDAYVPTKTTVSYGFALPAVEFYRHDFVTGRTERVSVASDGQERDGGLSTLAQITPDGRFVVFDSRADFTSPSPPPPCADATSFTCPHRLVYVRDMQTDVTSLAAWTSDQKPAAQGFAEGAMFASICASGRYVTFLTNSENMYPGQPARGQPGDSWWAYLRDRGSARGVGGLAAGQLTVAGVPSFATTGLLSRNATAGDVASAWRAAGGDIVGGTLVYRPASRDLYLRMLVAEMPTYAAIPPALVYVARLTVRGVTYELRAGKTASGPSFVLYAAAGNGWRRVATLTGGYGTVGAEVDVAVPTALLGAANGGRISHVDIATAIGTTDTGAGVVIDRLALA